MIDKIKKGDFAIAIEDSVHFRKGDKFKVLNCNVSKKGDEFVQISYDPFMLGVPQSGWFSNTYFKFVSRERKLKRILNER